MDERRKYDRKPTSVKVEFHHPSIGTFFGFARDISDGGASVLVENHPIPPKGTVLEVRFKKLAGHINEEPVQMRIVHTHRNVVGLMFEPRG